MQLFTFLGNAGLPYKTIMSNHTDFIVNKLLIPKARCVIAEQTHSANVHICISTDNGAGFDEHSQIEDCDALVTDIANQFLLIRTADCTPVLLYDEKTYCIGAVHSGREGTRKNIIGNTITVMQENFKSNPENIKAWIGAGICKKHYKVNEEIGRDFEASCRKYNIFVDESDLLFPDIQNVILQQMIEAGLVLGNISKNCICSYESESHFSFRRDGTHNRQINIIGMIDGKHYL
jgi:YfiH family protein